MEYNASLFQVLTPRVKAFDTALNCLQNHVNAVYDITVIYDDRDRYEAGKLLLLSIFIRASNKNEYHCLKTRKSL